MPAGISVVAPSMEMGSFDKLQRNSPAFMILQKDNLDSALPLLHVDEEDKTNFSKDVGMENIQNRLYSRTRISKSNDHLVLACLQAHQTNPLKKKPYSKSQDNIFDRNQHGKPCITLSTENFHDILNAKLRKVKKKCDHDESQKTSGNNHKHGQRKPFITTVKTGEFLMPPPEVAALLGIATTGMQTHENDTCPMRTKFKPLVSLSKKPEIRHNMHNARCPAALKATIDFSFGMMNATSFASESSNERAKGTKTHDWTGQSLPLGNVMYDRRVVRGSTFASAPTPMDEAQSIAARQAEARRRYIARKRAQSQALKNYRTRAGSPPPVKGRKHEPVQTEVFLEELFEKPDELETGTQTDLYYDQPAAAKFCPMKTGQDVCTQIESGELFNYDVEIQPVLEVLVGKTIEQALLEVLEEEELAALKAQQRRFMELRAAELAEQRRLEEQERRRRDEKNRCIREQEEAMKIEKSSEERVAAAVLLTGYIAELLPTVLEGLKMSGLLLDEIKADVEEGFMPWLMKEVKREMGNMIESRELLMDIIREILENRAETYRRLGEEYDLTRDSQSEILQDENLEGGNVDYDFRNYESYIVKNNEPV